MVGVFHSSVPGGIYIEVQGQGVFSHALALYFRKFDGFLYDLEPTFSHPTQSIAQERSHDYISPLAAKSKIGSTTSLQPPVRHGTNLQMPLFKFVHQFFETDLQLHLNDFKPSSWVIPKVGRFKDDIGFVVHDDFYQTDLEKERLVAFLPRKFVSKGQFKHTRLPHVEMGNELFLWDSKTVTDTLMERFEVGSVDAVCIDDYGVPCPDPFSCDHSNVLKRFRVYKGVYICNGLALCKYSLKSLELAKSLPDSVSFSFQEHLHHLISPGLMPIPSTWTFAPGERVIFAAAHTSPFRVPIQLQDLGTVTVVASTWCEVLFDVQGLYTIPHRCLVKSLQIGDRVEVGPNIAPIIELTQAQSNIGETYVKEKYSVAGRLGWVVGLSDFSAQVYLGEEHTTLTLNRNSVHQLDPPASSSNSSSVIDPQLLALDIGLPQRRPLPSQLYTTSQLLDLRDPASYNVHSTEFFQSAASFMNPQSVNTRPVVSKELRTGPAPWRGLEVVVVGGLGKKIARRGLRAVVKDVRPSNQYPSGLSIHIMYTAINAQVNNYEWVGYEHLRNASNMRLLYDGFTERVDRFYLVKESFRYEYTASELKAIQQLEDRTRTGNASSAGTSSSSDPDPAISELQWENKMLGLTHWIEDPRLLPVLERNALWIETTDGVTHRVQVYKEGTELIIRTCDNNNNRDRLLPASIHPDGRSSKFVNGSISKSNVLFLVIDGEHFGKLCRRVSYKYITPGACVVENVLLRLQHVTLDVETSRGKAKVVHHGPTSTPHFWLKPLQLAVMDESANVMKEGIKGWLDAMRRDVEATEARELLGATI